MNSERMQEIRGKVDAWREFVSGLTPSERQYALEVAAVREFENGVDDLTELELLDI